eukprot:199294-Amorphochlora_amoeboformis.AAC.1
MACTSTRLDMLRSLEIRPGTNGYYRLLGGNGISGLGDITPCHTPKCSQNILVLCGSNQDINNPT